YSASDAPRLIVEVVLPTPPFWLHIASTRAGPCSFTGGGTGISRTGRPVGPTRDSVPFVFVSTSSISSAPGLLVAGIVSGSNVDIARRLLGEAAVGRLSTRHGSRQSGSPESATIPRRIPALSVPFTGSGGVSPARPNQPGAADGTPSAAPSCRSP